MHSRTHGQQAVQIKFPIQQIKPWFCLETMVHVILLRVVLTVLAKISWGQQPKRKLLHTRGSSNRTLCFWLSPTKTQIFYLVHSVLTVSQSILTSYLRPIFHGIVILPHLEKQFKRKQTINFAYQLSCNPLNENNSVYLRRCVRRIPKDQPM